MKHLMNKYLWLGALLYVLGACQPYDASDIKATIGALEDEVSSMEMMVRDMTSGLDAIRQLIGSRFISYVGETEQGQKVIRYRNANSEEKTVVLVTSDKINKLPLIGAGLDTADRR